LKYQSAYQTAKVIHEFAVKGLGSRDKYYRLYTQTDLWLGPQRFAIFNIAHIYLSHKQNEKRKQVNKHIVKILYIHAYLTQNMVSRVHNFLESASSQCACVLHNMDSGTKTFTAFPCPFSVLAIAVFVCA